MKNVLVVVTALAGLFTQANAVCDDLISANAAFFIVAKTSSETSVSAHFTSHYHIRYKSSWPSLTLCWPSQPPINM